MVKSHILPARYYHPHGNPVTRDPSPRYYRQCAHHYRGITVNVLTITAVLPPSHYRADLHSLARTDQSRIQVSWLVAYLEYFSEAKVVLNENRFLRD